ncbi:MAG: hypothetical protein CL770_05360 [Chloroflexi bacterium]|nr:hypothetical protein [Chloroflexota bacterium]
MQEVLYRKWRPKNLDQVVGQEHMVKTLEYAIEQNRLSHAYLFCGPRGTGKTSTARILAKSINCKTPINTQPCDTCATCISFNKSDTLDLIEIDAASNRGIEDIRNIKEKIYILPTQGKFKIYIIDEAHMLTDPAFNALLKTLEEPPEHVIFILATTESHKLPLTIISRCQRFDFKRISMEIMITKLNQLCASENVTVSNEALQLISRKASGSLRDAENILEQAIISYGNSISETQISSFLELNTNNSEIDLITNLITKPIAEGLKIIINFSDSGGNIKQFNSQIVDVLRAVTLVKAGVNISSQGYSEEIQKQISKLSNLSTLESLSKITKIFSEPLLHTNETTSLNLELAFIQSHTLINQNSSPLKIPSHLQKSNENPQNSMPAKNTPQKNHTTNQPTVIQTNENPQNSIPTENTPQKNHTTNQPTVIQTNENPQNSIPTENWKTILSKLRKKGSRFDLSALLRSTTERKVENDQITLTYSHISHLERMITELEHIDTKKIFENTFSQVLGKEFKIIHITNDQVNKNNNRQLQSPLVKAAMAKGAQILDTKEVTNE